MDKIECQYCSCDLAAAERWNRRPGELVSPYGVATNTRSCNVSEAGLRELMETVKAMRNKQVEAFDRITFLEERVQGLLERMRRYEAAVEKLEKITGRRAM